MNRSTLVGVVIGAVLATGVAAVAGYRAFSGPEYAEVLAVEPVTRTVRTPREVCRDEVVTQQKPVKDANRITGSVVGAVVGGVLGSQVGSGSGRDAATVAGAAAGGYAGNRVQKRVQDGATVDTVEQRCETVYDAREEQTGEFDVRYRLNEQEGEVRMSRDPGDRIPVRDGKPVVDPA